jgi:hypothetical protein
MAALLPKSTISTGKQTTIHEMFKKRPRELSASPDYVKLFHPLLPPPNARDLTKQAGLLLLLHRPPHLFKLKARTRNF